MTVAELKAMATELGLDVKALKKKDEVVEAVFDAKVKAEGFVEISGVLDVLPEGYGFVRTSGYLPGDRDVYVSMSAVRRNELRRGDMVKGQVRPPKESEKYPALQRLDEVNGRDPEANKNRPRFVDLTPVYPDERLRMEHGPQFMTARTIDMVAPIGKGQRGLIVSPPKAGKTTVLKDIAASITANNPEVHLMCLLVDERPEEVTDMERSIHGEVVSSTFDMPADNHIAVAELVMERAKRLVESGFDVVILLDSITRLARAYNLAQPASGRILSGLRLDRNLADRRIFPAIDVITSGTRKEELLLDPQEAPFVWGVRRVLHGIDNTERAMDMLLKGLKQTESNMEFLGKMARKASDTRNGVDL